MLHTAVVKTGQDTSSLGERQFGAQVRTVFRTLRHQCRSVRAVRTTKLVPKCPGSEVSCVRNVRNSISVCRGRGVAPSTECPLVNVFCVVCTLQDEDDTECDLYRLQQARSAVERYNNSALSFSSFGKLIQFRFYVSLDTKQVISETFFLANLLAYYRRS